MSKDTFRGLIAGMLIMGLFFTGIPVSADTTDTFSNRLVAAINALKGSTDTTATKIGGVTTAINNQSSALSAAIGNISAAGSSGGGNSTVKAQCMGTSSSSGPGFVVLWGYNTTGGNAATYKVTLDGKSASASIPNDAGYSLTLYYQSSASLGSSLNGLVFKYV